MTQANKAGSIDPKRLEGLLGKVMTDVGGAVSLLLAYVGDQTGVWRTMARIGPATPAVIAREAGVGERYLEEWLASNAAAGYVVYDKTAGTFGLTPEQAMVFSAEGDPRCLQGFFQSVVAQYATHDKAVETFRSGAGRPWSDQHPCCFCATDRFFRPGYAANLVRYWLPALEGVTERLEAGGKGADIACGLGSSTILMAKRFPKSTFYGFDFHAPSIETAREHARQEGVEANTRFEVITAKDYPGTDYDLVCIFDALHDMGDPVGASRHIHASLKPDGTFMVVEPLAGDSIEENMHILGQISYGFSSLVCTPASRAQEVGLALGTQAGQKRLTAVLNEGGFTRVRRAAETQANMVLEARP